MTNFVKEIRSQGFELQYLNIGGGLGVDYYRRYKRTSVPMLVTVGWKCSQIKCKCGMQDLLQSLTSNSSIAVTEVM